jgi:hypothetical protein
MNPPEPAEAADWQPRPEPRPGLRVAHGADPAGLDGADDHRSRPAAGDRRADRGSYHDILVNELNMKGRDTVPQHNDAGTHYLEINSECSWTVAVAG